MPASGHSYLQTSWVDQRFPGPLSTADRPITRWHMPRLNSRSLRQDRSCPEMPVCLKLLTPAAPKISQSITACVWHRVSSHATNEKSRTLASSPSIFVIKTDLGRAKDTKMLVINKLLLDHEICVNSRYGAIGTRSGQAPDDENAIG